MAKEVVIVSPTTNKTVRISTEAKTWGELKTDPRVKELLGPNMDVIVRPGNTTLCREDAELPEANFNLYMIATKNKAGFDTEIVDAIRANAKFSTNN